MAETSGPGIESPPKAPWGAFPDVLIHAPKQDVKHHPAYRAAKSGDDTWRQAYWRRRLLPADPASAIRWPSPGRGGKVLTATVLAGKPYSVRLVLTPNRLEKLRNLRGPELENWRRERFAHVFDALTESEARYLARTPDADTIRNRIIAAEQA